MYRPFQISYHGSTRNGRVRAYKWRPLSVSLVLPGADTWTEDLGDTMRVFTNTKPDTLPASVFRLAAQCRDDAGAESPVAAGSFDQGVAQVVVNFDPDTRIHKVENTFNLAGVPTLTHDRLSGHSPRHRFVSQAGCALTTAGGMTSAISSVAIHPRSILIGASSSSSDMIGSRTVSGVRGRAPSCSPA